MHYARYALLTDDPSSKLNACVNKVFDIWKSGKSDKLTQMFIKPTEISAHVRNITLLIVRVLVYNIISKVLEAGYEFFKCSANS